MGSNAARVVLIVSHLVRLPRSVRGQRRADGWPQWSPGLQVNDALCQCPTMAVCGRHPNIASGPAEGVRVTGRVVEAPRHRQLTVYSS